MTETMARPGILGQNPCPATLGQNHQPGKEKTMGEQKPSVAEIRIKRVYEEVSPEDGRRILVDRLWPRGLSKEKAKIDFWPRELAPSTELRRWYGHDPQKWEEFRERYFQELEAQPQLLSQLREELARGVVTFLFSSKELEINNAVALKIYLESRG